MEQVLINPGKTALADKSSTETKRFVAARVYSRIMVEHLLSGTIRASLYVLDFGRDPVRLHIPAYGKEYVVQQIRRKLKVEPDKELVGYLLREGEGFSEFHIKLKRTVSAMKEVEEIMFSRRAEFLNRGLEGKALRDALRDTVRVYSDSRVDTPEILLEKESRFYAPETKTIDYSLDDNLYRRGINVYTKAACDYLTGKHFETWAAGGRIFN